MYAHQAVAVIHPQEVRVICMSCESSDTERLEHETTGQVGYGCYRCGCITLESESNKAVLVHPPLFDERD